MMGLLWKISWQLLTIYVFFSKYFYWHILVVEGMHRECAYVVHWLSSLPPSPLHAFSHLKQLQKISLFYFIYVHKAHPSYSPSFIPFIHSSPSHKYSPHQDLFYSLSFILNSVVSVPKGSSTYLSSEYTVILVSSTPSIKEGASCTVSFKSILIHFLWEGHLHRAT
jgi:hypothetical protein